jgi:pilus assembly protein Flp/PilA
MKYSAIDFLENESGATAIEYGLIASLIAVFLIAALTSVGTRISAVFSEIQAAMH